MTIRRQPELRPEHTQILDTKNLNGFLMIDNAELKKHVVNFCWISKHRHDRLILNYESCVVGFNPYHRFYMSDFHYKQLDKMSGRR